MLWRHTQELCIISDRASGSRTDDCCTGDDIKWRSLFLGLRMDWLRLSHGGCPHGLVVVSKLEFRESCGLYRERNDATVMSRLTCSARWVLVELPEEAVRNVAGSYRIASFLIDGEPGVAGGTSLKKKYHSVFSRDILLDVHRNRDGHPYISVNLKQPPVSSRPGEYHRVCTFFAGPRLD